MCIPLALLSNLALSLPFLWLLCMPIVGAFCGIDGLLRLSLIMCIHTIISKLFSRCLVFSESLVQLAALVLFVATPVTLVPAPIIWLYSKLLWWSEPVWLIAEVVSLVMLVRLVSQEALDHMDDEPGKAKGVLLFVIGGSYLLIVLMLVAMLKLPGGNSVMWLLAMTLALCVVLHVAIWITESGLLSEVAFISLCCIGAVYFIHHDMLQEIVTIQPPENWKSLAEHSSFLQMVLSFSTASLESAGLATQFLSQMLCPAFLASASVRLYTVVGTAGFLGKYLGIEVYEDEDEPVDLDLDDDIDTTLPAWMVRPWSCPLLVHLSLIFVYTQLVYSHICQSLPKHADFIDLWQFWPLSVIQDVPLGRPCQVIMLTVLYLLQLKSSDPLIEWDEKW